MSLLRQPLLLLARSHRVKRLVTAMPVSAGIVRSYVPGEDDASAVEASARLVADGLRVSLDHLGEDTLDADQADATVQAYLDLLAALSARGLTRQAEVSVKLSAIGQALSAQGDKIALENARTICRAARNTGTTVFSSRWTSSARTPSTSSRPRPRWRRTSTSSRTSRHAASPATPRSR